MLPTVTYPVADPDTDVQLLVALERPPGPKASESLPHLE